MNLIWEITVMQFTNILMYHDIVANELEESWNFNNSTPFCFFWFVGFNYFAYCLIISGKISLFY